jgi:hypothetical protein
MFGRLKDWRRVAMCFDRCSKVFLSAIALAATVLFWLWVLSVGPRPAAYSEAVDIRPPPSTALPDNLKKDFLG